MIDFTDILYMLIIFTLIVSVRTFYFCIIRWYQGNINWLEFMFARLENCLTDYRCIFLRNIVLYKNIVIIFIFIFRSNMNLNWIIFWKIPWMRNTWQFVSSYNFESISDMWYAGLPVLGVTYNWFPWISIVYVSFPILSCWYPQFRLTFELFHRLILCFLIVFKELSYLNCFDINICE